MVKEVIIISTLVLVTLAFGTTHDELLAANFELIPGVGYYYYGTDKNWTAAEKHCTSLGARLVVINSDKERDALVEWLNGKTKDYYISGGFTNANEPTFVTVEGISLEDAGYSTWQYGGPSGFINTCGIITTTTGELYDSGCDRVNFSYVCEHQLWVDYEFYEGLGHYRMHTEGQSWIEASKTCRSEGAHLVVLDSQEEADVIMGIYQRYTNLPNTTDPDVAYIGFRAVIEDLTTDPRNGTYITIFGASVSKLGYVKWYSTEPQPGNSFFCGVLRRQSANYMMYSCNSKLAFFCEKELQGFI